MTAIIPHQLPRGGQAGRRAFVYGQMNQGRKQTQSNAQPPNYVIGAELIKQFAAQPNAEERSQLMGHENKTEQGSHVTRAKNLRHDAGGQGHRG